MTATFQHSDNLMASRSALFNSIFPQQQMNLFLNEEWTDITQSGKRE